MNNDRLTALVFGASGLTGRFLIEHLIEDQAYGSIIVFVRKELRIQNHKIRQVTFDPERLENISEEVKGDHLFCCIGSTIKKAGSKEAFYKTDHGLVEKIAQVGSANKVRCFVVISSVGANSGSGNFYLRTKGQMEESIKTFNFSSVSIVRPSMLMGIRNEKRLGEEIAKKMYKILNPLLAGPLRKYKSIHASTVAKAMIKLAKQSRDFTVVESDELQHMAIEN